MSLQMDAVRGRLEDSAAGDAVSDHRMVPREVLAALSRPAPARWGLAIAVDWGVIAAAMIAAHRIGHPVTWALALIVIGSRQHAISILGHDAVHRAITRRRAINDGLAQVLCFWPMMSNLGAYAEFHLGHHKHLNTALDPEMTYRHKGAPGWDLPCTRRRVALRFMLDLCGFGTLEMMRILSMTRPRSVAAAIGPALWWGVAALIAWRTGALWAIAVYAASFLTGFSAVWRWRCWIEHLGTDDTHRIAVPWWQALWMAPHNVWMHWEHHHWAGVPCWKLPRLRARAAGHAVQHVGELFLAYERSAPFLSGAPTRSRRLARERDQTLS
jgi:fatty acid desaturase